MELWHLDPVSFSFTLFYRYSGQGLGCPVGFCHVSVGASVEVWAWCVCWFSVMVIVGIFNLSSRTVPVVSVNVSLSWRFQGHPFQGPPLPRPTPSKAHPFQGPPLPRPIPSKAHPWLACLLLLHSAMRMGAARTGTGGVTAGKAYSSNNGNSRRCRAAKSVAIKN